MDERIGSELAVPATRVYYMNGFTTGVFVRASLSDRARYCDPYNLCVGVV